MKIYETGKGKKSRVPAMNKYAVVLQFNSHETPERIGKEMPEFAREIARHYEGTLDFVGGIDPDSPSFKRFMREYVKKAEDIGHIEIRSLNDD